MELSALMSQNICPPEDVINFIEDIFKLAKKFVFIVIACYPAGKKAAGWEKYVSSFY